MQTGGGMKKIFIVFMAALFLMCLSAIGFASPGTASDCMPGAAIYIADQQFGSEGANAGDTEPAYVEAETTPTYIMYGSIQKEELGIGTKMAIDIKVQTKKVLAKEDGCKFVVKTLTPAIVRII